MNIRKQETKTGHGKLQVLSSSSCLLLYFLFSTSTSTFVSVFRCLFAFILFVLFLPFQLYCFFTCLQPSTHHAPCTMHNQRTLPHIHFHSLRPLMAHGTHTCTHAYIDRPTHARMQTHQHTLTSECAKHAQ